MDRPASATSHVLDVALWIAAIACVLITVGFSVLPPPQLAAATMSDKVQHALAYFFTVGFLLLAAVWRPGREGRFPRSGVPILIGAIVVGGVLEVVQAFLPNRQPELMDLGVDAVGALLAFGLWTAVRRART